MGLFVVVNTESLLFASDLWCIFHLPPLVFSALYLYYFDTASLLAMFPHNDVI